MCNSHAAISLPHNSILGIHLETEIVFYMIVLFMTLFKVVWDILQYLQGQKDSKIWLQQMFLKFQNLL